MHVREFESIHKHAFARLQQVFAPANLRAAAENSAYRQLVSEFIAEKYMLRYTGGFVPDVHHILTKVLGSIPH
jgi:fructose-1,6-bisphosphatase